MTHQLISLHEIDFSKPDGEFIYKGQSYQIKQYANNYFFRNKKHTSCDFICLLWYSRLIYYYPELPKYICQQNSSLLVLDPIIQEKDYYCLKRCIQYKEALFTFSVSQQGHYYSPKANEWSWLYYRNCQAFNRMSLDEILENDYELFIEQAKNAYEKEIPLIENDNLFDSFRRNTTKPIEFICGSESELTRLTKIAAFTLPEMKHIFERYSSLTVIYKSEKNINYKHGGFDEINAGDWNTGVIICRNEVILYGEDGNQKDTLSKQA